MNLLKQEIAKELLQIIGTNEITAEDIVKMLEYPPDEKMGDLALPCFRFSKVMRKSPIQIANDIASKFNSDKISKVEAVNGYLNLYISDNYLSNDLLPKILGAGNDYGKNELGKGKTALLDYSSPNICKPFHVGHLVTTIIGHSLKKIHQFSGYNCVGINHLGDWGTQFGKQIVAYKLWGNEEQVNKGGIDELAALYVKFHDEVESNPELLDQARAEFNKMELGDPENLRLWKWFIEISLKGISKIYEQLDIDFDSYNGESFYTDKMPEQVEVLREKGLLKLDNGASIVDLEKYGMPPCLILKSDGSTLYPTRDIAAAVYRKRTYNFDKCIYVTAAAQSLHFAQWFKVVELMGYDFGAGLVHVPYGMVSINGAKLATRTGNVILIKDLINAAVQKAKEIIDEKNPNLENKDETSEAVGIGAIIFYFLLNNKIKDINFVMDEALSFDGNTGPYAQYTYARTCSILEKAGEFNAKEYESKITAKEETVLLKTVSKFGEVVENALRDYEPSYITRYILDVCAAFNRFYQECKILSAEDPIVKATRLKITEATNLVLGNALSLICLKTPKKI